jgi:hypothetical protein
MQFLKQNNLIDQYFYSTLNLSPCFTPTPADQIAGSELEELSQIPDQTHTLPQIIIPGSPIMIFIIGLPAGIHPCLFDNHHYWC